MAETVQLDLSFEILEDEMLNPLLGHKLSETEGFVATALLAASSERPLKIREIIQSLKQETGRSVSDREIKKIVRSLRRDHAFPILSRKEKPAGYFWARSEMEMKQFIETWSAQYKDEASTLSLMVKKHYPRLSGQLDLFRDTTNHAA